MSEQVQEQRPTVEEMVDSLTGFDEIAVEQAFGNDVISMLQKNPTMGGRALVFIAKRRDGMKDPDARKAAMEMRLGEVQAYFPDEAPEVNEDEPVTAVGKGDEQPE